MIKIDTIGRILKGDNESWYVLVKEDFENTGGYLILISNDSNFKSEEGRDYWVENYDNLTGFFGESKWEIQWLDKSS